MNAIPHSPHNGQQMAEIKQNPIGSSAAWNPALGGDPNLDPNKARRAARQKAHTATTTAPNATKPAQHKLCRYGVRRSLRDSLRPCRGHLIRCTCEERNKDIELQSMIDNNVEAECISGKHCKFHEIDIPADE